VLCVVALIYRTAIAAAAAGAGGSDSDMPRSAGNSACSDAAAEAALGAMERHAAALQAAVEGAGLGALLQADIPLPLPAYSIPTAQRLCAASLRLAAALLEYWQQPEQAAQAQLEAAQAAAARSCAYLHCANLGGQGGPAAGEGEGSARCRWCCAERGGAVQVCLLCIVWAACVWLLAGCTPPVRLQVACCELGTSFIASVHLLPSTLLLPFAAVPAALFGTAALPARTPTGGRGTAACARRWAQRGRRRRSGGGRRWPQQTEPLVRGAQQLA